MDTVTYEIVIKIEYQNDAYRMPLIVLNFDISDMPSMLDSNITRRTRSGVYTVYLTFVFYKYFSKFLE